MHAAPDEAGGCNQLGQAGDEIPHGGAGIAPLGLGLGKLGNAFVDEFLRDFIQGSFGDGFTAGEESGHHGADAVAGGGILQDGGGTTGKHLGKSGGHGAGGGAGGSGGTPGILVAHAVFTQFAVGFAVKHAGGLHAAEGHGGRHGAGGDGGGDTGGHACDGAGDGSTEAGVGKGILGVDQSAGVGGIGGGEGRDGLGGAVVHQTGGRASGAEDGAGDIHEAGGDIRGDEIPPATPGGASLHFIRVGEGLLDGIGGGHGVLLAPLGEVLSERGLIGESGEECLAIHAAVFRPEFESGLLLLGSAGGLADDSPEGGLIGAEGGIGEEGAIRQSAEGLLHFRDAEALQQGAGEGFLGLDGVTGERAAPIEAAARLHEDTGFLGVNTESLGLGVKQLVNALTVGITGLLVLGTVSVVQGRPQCI